MAIAFDTATQGSGSSYSHTVGSHSNLILFVSVTGGSSFTDTITGVTYNSVSMTLLGKSEVSGDRWNYLFYLFNPDTGSNTVDISYTGGGSGAPGSSVASSYYGVGKQTIDTSVNDYGTDTNGHTGSVTTTIDGCWLVGAMHVDATPSAGTGTTFRGDRLWDSNGSVGTAGSHSLALTWGGTAGYSFIIASIAPNIDYPLTADVQSYTLTGIATNFIKDISTGVIDAVNYTLTGIDTVLKYGYGIVATVATYTLTGIDTILNIARTMGVSVSSYTLTGIDITLRYGYMMAVEKATFTLNYIGALFTRFWRTLTKNTVSVSNTSKNSESVINVKKSNVV